MNSVWLKILIIVIIFIAEAASIFCEILAAKHYSGPDPSFWKTFIKMFVLILIFASLITAGYMLGIKSFKNIWIVSVISIISILIAEPIIAYGVFKQLPTKGATIGLILGALGFAPTLLLK